MSGHTDIAPLTLLDRDFSKFAHRIVDMIAWSFAVTHGYERMLRRGEKVTAETLNLLANDALDHDRR